MFWFLRCFRGTVGKPLTQTVASSKNCRLRRHGASNNMISPTTQLLFKNLLPNQASNQSKQLSVKLQRPIEGIRRHGVVPWPPDFAEWTPWRLIHSNRSKTWLLGRKQKTLTKKPFTSGLFAAFGPLSTIRTIVKTYRL